MSYLPIFILSSITHILAVIVTLIVTYKPNGYIPATYGCVQTLANLIGDWGRGTRGDNRLYQGDKGALEGFVRHTGTSDDAIVLREIEGEAFYCS